MRLAQTESKQATLESQKYIRYDPVEGGILKRTIIGDPTEMEQFIESKEKKTIQRRASEKRNTSSKLSL